MLIRIKMDLAFEIANQAQALREAIVPFAQHAINVHEGESNEEIGYIEVENCGHNEDPPAPCTIIARWEVGRGRVI